MHSIHEDSEKDTEGSHFGKRETRKDRRTKCTRFVQCTLKNWPSLLAILRSLGRFRKRMRSGKEAGVRKMRSSELLRTKRLLFTQTPFYGKCVSAGQHGVRRKNAKNFPPHSEQLLRDFSRFPSKRFPHSFPLFALPTMASLKSGDSRRSPPYPTCTTFTHLLYVQGLTPP